MEQGSTYIVVERFLIVVKTSKNIAVFLLLIIMK